jgi:NAD+ diphosphatase
MRGRARRGSIPAAAEASPAAILETVTPFFVPGISPPSVVSTRTLVFRCRGSEILVAASGPGAEIPLGPEPQDCETHYLGALGGIDCFASALGEDEEVDGLELRHLRALYGVLPDDHWALAGRAVQLVEWERTHRFCGVCGAPTEACAGERARRCTACEHLAFPRLSPAVIVLVRRGSELLLARGRRFTEPIYSCIAGFVDPGESLEEAVAREVREEVGIDIADIRYFGSQSWPFPHSLMIGFTASWAGGEIALEEEELLDAGWFTAEALPELPPRLSIARRLIDSAFAKSG